MARINCEHCGSSISDKAPFCPKCGFLRVKAVSKDSLKHQYCVCYPKRREPLKTPKGLWEMVIIGLLILAGGIVWIVLGVHKRHQQYLADLEYQQQEFLRHEEQQRLEAELYAAEQARLDSLRQDSIEREEKMRLSTPPLKIKDLCYKEDSRFRLKSNLANILERNGFKLIESERFYSDLITSEDVVLSERRVYLKEGTSIILEIAIEEGYIGNDQIEINFASSNQQATFLEEALNIGFKKVESTFYISGEPYGGGVCIWINGNVITVGYPAA